MVNEAVPETRIIVAGRITKFTPEWMKEKWPYIHELSNNGKRRVGFKDMPEMLLALMFQIVDEERVPEGANPTQHESILMHRAAVLTKNLRLDATVLCDLFSRTASTNIREVMQRVWNVREGVNMMDYLATNLEPIVMCALPAEILDELLSSTEIVIKAKDVADLCVQWKLFHPTDNGRGLDRLLLHFRYDIMLPRYYPSNTDKADCRMKSQRLAKSLRDRSRCTTYSTDPARLPRGIEPLYWIMVPDSDGTVFARKASTINVDYIFSTESVEGWSVRHTMFHRHPVTVGPYSCSIITSFGNDFFYAAVTIDHREQGDKRVSLAQELQKHDLFFRVHQSTDLTQWYHFVDEKFQPAIYAIPRRINNQGLPDWRNARPVIRCFNKWQANKLIPEGQNRIRVRLIFDVVITKQRK